MINSLTFMTATSDTTGTIIGSPIASVVMIVLIFVLSYFMIIRPQKKQQKKQDELIASLAIGDVVLTTAGFYGVVIDIVDENVITVEFGNNKNCRIPMKKTSVVEIEKQN